MATRTSLDRGVTRRTSRSIAPSGRKLTVGWVVADLGISQRTFYRWKKDGTAPDTFALPGGSLRIYESVYLAWLEDRSREGIR